MGFVIDLPPTLGKFDFIWVIWDTLTKSTHFALAKVNYNAEKLAKINTRDIVQLYGVLIFIISDRGMQFTLIF